MTNEVHAAAATAASIVDPACDAFVREYSRGQELIEQLWSWLLDRGIEFSARIIAALVILFLGVVAIRLLSAIVRKALLKSKRINPLLANFICSVVSKTSWILLVLVLLQKLGVDVAPLVAGLGVTGFIVGFAFQETLGNFASGLMIAINQPFKVGDYIIAGGVEGSVIELNMMATVVSTPDNKRITVPNKSVWGSAITNFTALEKRRVDISVGIEYGADVAKARAVAVDTMKSIEGVLDDPAAPMVEVASLDDSQVLLTVRAWCRTADYWNVFFAGNRKILAAFDANGVGIPFPQLTVHMAKDE